MRLSKILDLLHHVQGYFYLWSWKIPIDLAARAAVTDPFTVILGKEVCEDFLF